LCLVAKGRGRKRQRPTTTLVASSDRHRQSVRRGNPGHRHDRQSHAQKMPGLQDPSSGNPQRAWQRRANPVCIALLHLAPESRHLSNDSQLSGPMAKVAAKRKKRPKRTDPEQFERFVEAARKLGVNESMEDFTVKFRK